MVGRKENIIMNMRGVRKRLGERFWEGLIMCEDLKVKKDVFDWCGYEGDSWIDFWGK